MSRRVDLSGQTFGSLLVVEYSHSNDHGEAYYHCLCSCGVEAYVRASHLKDGRVQRCMGCGRKAAATAKMGKSPIKYNGERQKIAIVCARCGTIFYNWASQNQKYCSNTCRYDSSILYRPQKPCLFCGKLYVGDFYHKGKSKYCSHACAGKHQSKSVLITCPTCHTVFEGKLCSNRKYCSKPCADLAKVNPNRKRLYPPEFNKALKVKVWSRDGYACQICGKRPSKNTPVKLHTHHIDHDIDNNLMSNLVTLCPGCHIVMGRKRDWDAWIAYWQQYLSDKYGY